MALLSGGGDNADKVAIFMRILGGVASPRSSVIHCCVPLSEIELSLRDTYALPFSVQDTRKLDNMIFMDMSSRTQSDNRYAWYHRLKLMNHPAFSASGDPHLYLFFAETLKNPISKNPSQGLQEDNPVNVDALASAVLTFCIIIDGAVAERATYSLPTN